MRKYKIIILLGIVALSLTACSLVATKGVNQPAVQTPQNVGGTVHAGKEYFNEGIEITGDVTANNNLTVNGSKFVFNGLNYKMFSGTFTEASTTLFSIRAADYFSASSTCSAVNISMNNGTTTTDLIIATSSTGTIDPAGLTKGVVHWMIGSSSPGTVSSKSAITAPDGFVRKEVALESWIVGPSDYILGHATGSVASKTSSNYDVGGITGNSNTYSGSYKILCTY